MKLSKLRRKVERQARRARRNGSMDAEKFEACMAVVENPSLLAQLNEHVEGEVNPWKREDGLIGASWRELLANAWDWFQENWEAILLFILKLAPLLLILDDEND